MIFKKRVRDTPLPSFRYHPDPIATGAIVSSVSACVCCKRKTGAIYTGPVYSRHSKDEPLCPWCIASGKAHKKLGATFCDTGRAGDWTGVPEAVIEEVTTRTPGFTAWQDNEWWAHDGDAGAYLGMITKEDLERLGPDTVKQWRAHCNLEELDYPDEMFEEMGPDRDVTGYLFRCLHTGVYGGFIDAN